MTDAEIAEKYGLDAREVRIARAAAELASDLTAQKMEDSFYRSIGKTVVTRLFLFVGILGVGIAYGKGINLSSLFGK
jgi:hypothetical protein